MLSKIGALWLAAKNVLPMEKRAQHSSKLVPIEDSSEKVNKIRRKKIEGVIHFTFLN